MVALHTFDIINDGDIKLNEIQEPDYIIESLKSIWNNDSHI